MKTEEQVIPMDLKTRVIEWRRHLHANPELSFQEQHTSQFIYDTLNSFGGLKLSRPTSTSVVARLLTGRPGPILAIRADMDALPILEENHTEYVSQNPGVMHACGHDGHTAMLLATAGMLLAERDVLQGEVRFLFQHAEELSPGGAEEMVEAGVMDGVDSVIGAHLWVLMPVGKVAVRAGALLAAPDQFTIHIHGKGGHAAQPNITVDTVAVAAQVVTNLQHIVSRNVDPLDPAVVSVTRIQAGTAFNVIPGAAELAGTVRTFEPELRSEIPVTMERIIRGVCEAHGASYTFEYERGYRPVINDARVTEVVRRALVSEFDDGTVMEAKLTMGGEDFSAFQQKAPGSFLLVGAGNTRKGITYPHHHPRFDIDEDALWIGVRAFVAVARDVLGTAV